jgi:predicted nucleotidyltransferase
MENVVEKNRQAIEDVCRKYHVKRMDIFGSAAMGDATESSDIDFLVEFDDSVSKHRFDNYFELLRELRQMLGRDVDLVEPGGLRNPYFIRRMNETRRQVYVAS